MTYAAGDLVKLTDRFASTLMRHPRCRVDWVSRRGVVKSGNHHDVLVVWNGNATPDKLPVRAVEMVARHVQD